MKARMLSFLITLFLITQLTYSQSGWFWINPYPTGDAVEDIVLTNNETGYLTAGGKSIFFTTNFGSNWIAQKTDTANNFRTISFINENTGYAGGCDYYYYNPYNQFSCVSKTTNGGRYWGRIYLDSQYIITSIKFINENFGFAYGENYHKRNFIITTNGGVNWREIQFDTNFVINSYDFPTAQIGFVAGHFGNNSQGKIYKTSDGGYTWLLITLPVDIFPKSIQFLDEYTGYAATNRVIKTTNGGINWFSVYLTLPNIIRFLNHNTGFAANNNNQIAKTTNGGINWNNSIVQSSGEISSLFFSDENYGFAVAGRINIFRTTNGGINWTKLSSSFTNKFIYSLYSLNQSTVFAAADNSVLRSLDKGDTWLSKDIFDEGFTTVEFFNSQTGFTAGGYGPLYKTTDSGDSWFFNSSNMGNIWMFDFPDALTGYAVGRWNNILKTTDAGTSWIKIPTEFTVHHHQSVYFTDNNTGYTASEYGRIHKTTNGGWNWSIVYQSSQDIFLFSVFFTNASTGFAAGRILSYGLPIILKTTDAGQTWSESILSRGSTLYCTRFYNERIGYSVGSSGTIYCTTDGGENWIFQPTGTSKVLYSVICLDSLTAIAVGSEGTVLKTTNGGFRNEEGPPVKKIPTAYRLLQNYPNPFNPLTRIKFEIPVLSHVKLVIYDLLGRQVAVLINSELAPDFYEVEWNGYNYASGVYFYQLSINNEQLATKKMVLLK